MSIVVERRYRNREACREPELKGDWPSAPQRLDFYFYTFWLFVREYRMPERKRLSVKFRVPVGRMMPSMVVFFFVARAHADLLVLPVFLGKLNFRSLIDTPFVLHISVSPSPPSLVI